MSSPAPRFFESLEPRILLDAVASIASGAWENASTWENGRIPLAGDVVTIDSAHEVIYDDLAPDALGKLTIDGTLRFDNATSLELQSEGNIVVTGELELRPSSTAVKHTVTFVNVDEAAFVGGGMTVLDSDVGLWVIDGGILDAIGAAKTSWTRLTGSASEHDTTITVEDATGWQIGDAIVITPTQPPTDAVGSAAWNGYDERTISAINGNTLTLDSALNHDHPEVNGQWRAEVMNLTRNVVIQGTEQGRAHVIFNMVDNPQTIENIEIRHMGPRQIDPNQNPAGTTKNVLGRYGLHFHHGNDDTRGTIVDGLSLHHIGSHAYVPHASRGITIRDSISHNTWDDAFWWDPGATNATHDGLWDGNIASMVRVDPSFRGFRLTGYRLGAGNGNTLINSVAVGVQGNKDASGFEWPENTVGSIWIFNNNIAHNNKVNGIFTWQNGVGFTHLIEDFVAYHNSGSGIDHGAYSNHYIYRDNTLYGNKKAGIEMHANGPDGIVNQMTFENNLIDGAGITANGFVVPLHVTSPPLLGATLVQGNTVQNLASGGRAVNFAYNKLAQGPGDRGADPTMPNSSHREWYRFINNDFSDIPVANHFFAQGFVDGTDNYGILPESDIYVETLDGEVFTLRSLHFDTTFTNDFLLDPNFTTGDAWPWQWVHQHVSGTQRSITVKNDQGSIADIDGETGAELMYIKSRQAIDIDQTVKLRVTDDLTLAGLIARRDDEDRETYYEARLGAADDTAHYLTIRKRVDGVVTDLAVGVDYLTPNTDYQLRFEVVDDGAGGTNLRAKLWQDGQAEPVTWNLEVTGDTEARLQNKRGRFGVSADVGGNGREVIFDDYSATTLDPVTFNTDWNAHVEQWAEAGSPIIDVGPNQSIARPGTLVAIDATIIDDGVTNPTTNITYAWSVVSGPGHVIFSDLNSIDTNAIFDTAGQYVLRLTADDGTNVSSEDLRVTVTPSQSTGQMTDDWTGANGDPWASHWTRQDINTPLQTVDIQSNMGRINTSSDAGSTVLYVNDRNAQNVDLVTQIRVNANASRAGVIARRADSDPDTYLGAQFGVTTHVNDAIRIFMVVDGKRTDLQKVTSTLTGGVDYVMRFKVQSNADGTMNLQLKVWEAGTTEPTEWTVEQLNWSNEIFEGRTGRFGVHATLGTNRRVFFDNLQADILDTLAPVNVQVTEDWTGTNNDPWPAQWTSQHMGGAVPIVNIQSNEGYMNANVSGGTMIMYVNNQNAENVDLLTDIRLSTNAARGGLIARRADADPDTYLGARFGVTTLPADQVQIYAVIDGVQTSLATATSNFVRNVDYQMRFNVITNADGTMDLRLKIWETNTAEPADWTLEMEDWSNARFSGLSGRFGVIGALGVIRRKAYFDNFVATIIDPQTLLAERSAAASELQGLSPLQMQQVSVLKDEAIARWVALGISPEAEARLADTDVVISDLTGNLLGLAGDDDVFLDHDAAGHGWYVDPSAEDDVEFVENDATPEGIDLLTVLMHEFGHRLGLSDQDATDEVESLMDDTLPQANRRNPDSTLIGSLPPRYVLEEQEVFAADIEIEMWQRSIGLERQRPTAIMPVSNERHNWLKDLLAIRKKQITKLNSHGITTPIVSIRFA